MQKLSAFVVLAALATAAAAQMSWYCVEDSAPWEARFGQQLVVFHDTIWLFGGSGDDRRSLNDVWYSTTGDAWLLATASAPWSPRSSPRSFVFDDKLWLTGGFFWNGSFWDGLDDVWWTSDGFSWTQATDSAGWAPRAIHTALVYRDSMWVIGGLGNTRSTDYFYNDVWKSADGVTWECVTESAPWSRRGGHTSVVLRDTLWVFCGYGCSDIWCTGDGRQWAPAGVAPWGVRYGHNSLLLRDTVWLMAGYDAGTGTYYNDVWYSATGASWLRGAEHAEWEDRHLPASMVYDDWLWISGGTHDYRNGLGDVWRSSGLTAVAEPVTPGHGQPLPGIVHGKLFLPGSPPSLPASLYSRDGRKALDLRSGANDVSRLAPGVYFVRVPAAGTHGSGDSRVAKVVVAK